MYKFIFTIFLHPFFDKIIKRRRTIDFYENFKKNDSLSLNSLEAIQLKKLKKLLLYCQEFVPYYKKNWELIAFDPNKVCSVKDIEVLPILTKKIISKNYNDLISTDSKIHKYPKKTGGSTGVPLEFMISGDSSEKRTALMYRGYGWTGAEIGKKTLYIWGADFATTTIQKIKKYLYDAFYNRRVVNSYDTEGDKTSTINYINSYKPEVIVSFTTPLYLLSQYINENDLSIFSPKIIVTGAEALYEYQRISIESAFNCKVTNTYGCREFMLIAAECEMHNGLHINIDNLVVEIDRDTSNNYSGNAGEILVTDLSNYAFPFIRYKNGDAVKLSDHQCSCGMNYPLMENIEGRSVDSISLKNGEVLSGLLFPHMLKDISGLKQFQILQQKNYNLVCKFIVDKNLYIKSDSENFIINAVFNSTDGQLKVKFEYVNSIPKSTSGKFRVTMSEIK